MRPVVAKFMPGENLEDAMAAVRKLRAEGTPTIVTYLGENVATDAAADLTVAEYELLFAALKTEGADAHVSIKLTQFGWDVDQSRALERVSGQPAVRAQLRQAGLDRALHFEAERAARQTLQYYEEIAG